MTTSKRAAFLALLGLMSFTVSGTAWAAGIGSFAPSTSMTKPRAGAAAAKLPGGDVLVAGGAPDATGEFQSSAEVFSFGTGLFGSSGVGSMSGGRYAAAAAPLGDGRVLIAGGCCSLGASYDTAEVFDPSTRSFTLAGHTMPFRRSGAAAAPLPGGGVLVAGGAGDTGFSTTEALVFDGLLFHTVGRMATPRVGAAAAPLGDGRVLVAGGFYEDPVTHEFNTLQTAEIFNPVTQTFSAAGVGLMSSPRVDAIAAPLPDGRVLVAGGTNSLGSELASAEIFDPKTGTFGAAGGTMTSPRRDADAAALPDGRVLIVGGANGFDPLASAEIYSASNAFDYKLAGRVLTVRVMASGAVTVADAGASASAKKRRKALLKTSTVVGDPPSVTVKLALSQIGKKRLRKRGRISIDVAITFKPAGGLPNVRSLTLKAKARKTKKG